MKFRHEPFTGQCSEGAYVLATYVAKSPHVRGYPFAKLVEIAELRFSQWGHCAGSLLAMGIRHALNGGRA